MESTVIFITFLFEKFFPSLALVSTIMTIGTFCRVENGRWYQIHWIRSFTLGVIAAVIFLFNVPVVSIFLVIGQIAGLAVRTKNRNGIDWSKISFILMATIVVLIINELSWSFPWSACVLTLLVSSIAKANSIILLVVIKFPFARLALAVLFLLIYVVKYTTSRSYLKVSPRVNEVIEGVVLLAEAVAMAGVPLYLYVNQILTLPLYIVILLLACAIILLILGIIQICGFDK